MYNLIMHDFPLHVYISRFLEKFQKPLGGCA